ncbi:hypothetical protein [uncultured Desulfuromusa sp.]|uniref:hypothetical protein n=1 Tax=uncultured Desulfuromusa sp. TaxID=219183 RepID=UPI002AA5F469|nr:hypothetical protein [uncultured Desulfuromusa sp.]
MNLSRSSGLFFPDLSRQMNPQAVKEKERIRDEKQIISGEMFVESPELGVRA